VFTYVCLGTDDPARAARFYDAVLGALGHRRCKIAADDPEWRDWHGWGTYERGGAEELALWLCPPFDGRPASAGNGTMVAFSARSWNEVDRFHAEALAQGGSSEGAPGLRPQYNADFYAAYVRDPDGNKLAAVCRGYTQRPSI
jgi:catechol 2,3-dioxygenase-like lactoylglutathione lyase family enzyme